MRVSELAKKIGVPTKELMARLSQMGIAVSHHAAALSDADVQAVLAKTASASKPASAPKPAPAPAKKPVARGVSKPPPPPPPVEKKSWVLIKKRSAPPPMPEEISLPAPVPVIDLHLPEIPEAVSQTPAVESPLNVADHVADVALQPPVHHVPPAPTVPVLQSRPPLSGVVLVAPPQALVQRAGAVPQTPAKGVAKKPAEKERKRGKTDAKPERGRGVKEKPAPWKGAGWVATPEPTDPEVEADRKSVV